jgi:hypothetical protein
VVLFGIYVELAAELGSFPLNLTGGMEVNWISSGFDPATILHDAVNTIYTGRCFMTDFAR